MSARALLAAGVLALAGCCTSEVRRSATTLRASVAGIASDFTVYRQGAEARSFRDADSLARWQKLGEALERNLGQIEKHAGLLVEAAK